MAARTSSCAANCSCVRRAAAASSASVVTVSASEATWDGGNVKISVNGGDFVEIPAAAWIFNGPQGQLATAAEGNSNPLAGQTAFTGTDGGEPTGSWGTSVISLGRAGAKAGDTVQFRFDFGRDGCNGVDGWYVDDVEVTVCEDGDDPEPAATETEVKGYFPNPVREGKPFLVMVKVSGEGVPTGTVQVADGTRVLGEASVRPNGTARVLVKKPLRSGKYDLTATYLGDESFAPSSDTFKVWVVKKRRR